VHIDWAHNKILGNILVIVDSFSWLKAIPCPSRSSSAVINALREVFSRFGVPHSIVSDNAKEFKSDELGIWCSATGIHQVFSPEYHPQSNGLAERMVRHVKEVLRIAEKTHTCPRSFLAKALLMHRTTAKREDGKTPAEILMGRHLRTPILGNYGEAITYNPRRGSFQPATFIMKNGRNTSFILNRSGQPVVAHDNQIARRLSDRIPRPPPRWSPS